MNRVYLILLTLIVGMATNMLIYAHSGRTDSKGGHNDNKNASGLGSYHYHHGYGPHLHPNGICPYSPKDVITISNKPSSMNIGDTLSLHYKLQSDYGTNITWTSTNENVISVSYNGSLKANSKGTATIKGESRNGSVSFTITVREVPVQKIVINGIKESLPINETLQLSADILPENATYKEIAWTSSDTAVATISNSGFIKALGSGTTTISVASQNGKVSKFLLSVYVVPAEKIVLDNISSTLYIEDRITLGANVYPSNTTYPVITWSIDNSEVATINSKGQISALSEGVAIITATCQEYSDSKEITVVRRKVSSITFKLEKMGFIYDNVNENENIVPDNILNLGESIKPIVGISPSNATFKDVNYTSSNPEIIHIESDEFIAVGYGTATITAENMDCVTTIDIKVPKPTNYAIYGGSAFVISLTLIILRRKRIKKKKLELDITSIKQDLTVEKVGISDDDLKENEN